MGLGLDLCPARSGASTGAFHRAPDRARNAEGRAPRPAASISSTSRARAPGVLPWSRSSPQTPSPKHRDLGAAQAKLAKPRIFGLVHRHAAGNVMEILAGGDRAPAIARFRRAGRRSPAGWHRRQARSARRHRSQTRQAPWSACWSLSPKVRAAGAAAGFQKQRFRRCGRPRRRARPSSRGGDIELAGWFSARRIGLNSSWRPRLYQRLPGCKPQSPGAQARCQI